MLDIYLKSPEMYRQVQLFSLREKTILTNSNKHSDHNTFGYWWILRCKCTIIAISTECKQFFSRQFFPFSHKPMEILMCLFWKKKTSFFYKEKNPKKKPSRFRFVQCVKIKKKQSELSVEYRNRTKKKTNFSDNKMSFSLENIQKTKNLR